MPLPAARQPSGALGGRSGWYLPAGGAAHGAAARAGAHQPGRGASTRALGSPPGPPVIASSRASRDLLLQFGHRGATLLGVGQPLGDPLTLGDPCSGARRCTRPFRGSRRVWPPRSADPLSSSSASVSAASEAARGSAPSPASASVYSSSPGSPASSLRTSTSASAGRGPGTFVCGVFEHRRGDGVVWRRRRTLVSGTGPSSKLRPARTREDGGDCRAGRARIRRRDEQHAVRGEHPGRVRPAPQVFGSARCSSTSKQTIDSNLSSSKSSAQMPALEQDASGIPGPRSSTAPATSTPTTSRSRRPQRAARTRRRFRSRRRGRCGRRRPGPPSGIEDVLHLDQAPAVLIGHKALGDRRACAGEICSSATGYRQPTQAPAATIAPVPDVAFVCRRSLPPRAGRNAGPRARSAGDPRRPCMLGGFPAPRSDLVTC